MRTSMLAIALLTACGSSSDGEDFEDVEFTTTGSTSSTTAPSDPSSSSTSDEASSRGSSGSGSTGDTDTDTNTNTTGPNLDPGPVECDESECGISCSQELYDEEDHGGICVCDNAVEPEGLIECELARPCDGAPDELRCIAQALRYNAPGEYEIIDDKDQEDQRTIRYEVFGSGLVRMGWYNVVDGCCAGTVSTYQRYRFPQSTLAADEPFWETCSLDHLWGVESCFNEDVIFPETDCQPRLEACPELPAPGETCEDTCPMANDGVCDESSGTGLCADGCDPLDCA